MNSMAWYNALARPTWTPSPSTIRLIWTILYPIIAVTFGFVFIQAFRGQLPWIVVLPFAINLASNLTFTLILFGLRNLPLASVDILVVLGTIVWAIIAVWPHYRWVAVAQSPYLIWVSIATVLQFSITWANRQTASGEAPGSV